MSMRQKVDIYMWRGIICARKWPETRSRTRTAGEIASSDKFRVATIATGAIGSNVAELWKGIMTGKGVTWVDCFRATALGNDWIGTL